MDADLRSGPYAVMDGAPRVGERGLLVSASFRPADPRRGVVQGVVAHAHDAAGWWIGIGADGRALVGVGTTTGPVSLAIGPPLDPGVDVRVHARFPGAPGHRLEARIVVDGRETGAARAVVGSAAVPAPGSVVWGARALRDRRVPEHPFVGEIGDVSMAADASAAEDDDSAEGFLGRWGGWILVDASRFEAQEPVRL